jgi:AcrR family transcriptional regulator
MSRAVAEKPGAEKPLSRREQNRLAKHARALEAALTVFSQKGYAATTMDAIAAEAGLTKPTLYQYFPGKDDLFREMMLAPRNEMMLAFDRSSDECHVRQLWEFSWAYAKIVMHPDYLALARLVIGDAVRYPEIARAYQANGPDKVLNGLTQFMTEQAELGHLLIDDAELAAEDFWGLILSAPRNRALHLADAPVSKKVLSKYINNGIKVFLRAYSTNVSADLTVLESLMSKRKR